MNSVRIICLLVGKQFRILGRSPAVLAVMFLPGIVLYSIFTAIFAGPAGRPFRVAVVDQDRSPASRALIETLGQNKVRIITTENEAPDGPPLTEESAVNHIRRQGKYRVALVIPEGYGQSPFATSGRSHRGVIVYHDTMEPIEAQILTGMIQMAAGRQYFEKMVRPLTGALAGAGDESTSQPDKEQAYLVRVERRDVAAKRMKIAAKHTFLAGIVPMMLLFSATGAARGLLEELRSGEIRRLLAAPIASGHILVAQLLATAILAALQCYVTYVFAWLVFGVEIWNVTTGLFVLTVATSLAVTGFGVFLGSFCRQLEQLDSIGTVVILSMSAVGGSMVPRWIMPDWMQTLGLLTLNGWAYDGFMGLIQGRGLGGIALQCAVLTAAAVGFAAIGCVILARRLRAGPTP